MKNLQLKEAARRRAERYAPAPVDTRLMYGVVAASMMLVATIAAAAFYGLELEAHLSAVAALASAAFIGGLLVRIVQVSRHRRAHRFEYDCRRPLPGQSGAD